MNCVGVNNGSVEFCRIPVHHALTQFAFLIEVRNAKEVVNFVAVHHSYKVQQNEK